MNLSTTEACCLKNLAMKVLSNLDIARQLGFLLGEKDPQYRVLHVIATQGKLIKSEIWQERGNPTTYRSDPVKEFLSRQKCLKCERRVRSDKTVTCFRPYCRKCYYTIVHNDLYEEQIIIIDPEVKREIRSKMSWMRSIDSKWEGNETCSMCNSKATDHKQRILTNEEADFQYASGGNYVQLTTWWFGEDKRICEICFDSTCRKQDLYKLIPA